MIDCLRLPLAEIARALREQTLCSRELVQSGIALHDTLDPTLSAYKTWQPEQALLQAEAADRALEAGQILGPLQGIPVSVKDLFGVNGMPTYAGTARRLPPRWEREGALVNGLRRQRAVITGKTHSAECAIGGLGINHHWETPRNPWDATNHRVPGGSSSGAAVSVAEGSALLALGTDTGGSVRVPASMTGLAGLKVTAGRWSVDGAVPLSSLFDSAGLICRRVADLAWGFSGLDGMQRSQTPQSAAIDAADLSKLRIGVGGPELWDQCAPGIAETVTRALDEMAASGVRVERVRFAEVREAMELLAHGSAVAAQCNAFVDRELPEWRELMGPVVAKLIDEGALLSDREYLRRRRRLAALSQQPVATFSRVDMIATPTVPITPPALNEVRNVEDYRGFNRLVLRNTSVVNLLGLCAITLPVGLDAAGMPVGLQLIAPGNTEEKLLAAGIAVEQALGTGEQRLGVAPLCRVAQQIRRPRLNTPRC